MYDYSTVINLYSWYAADGGLSFPKNHYGSLMFVEMHVWCKVSLFLLVHQAWLSFVSQGTLC